MSAKLHKPQGLKPVQIRSFFLAMAFGLVCYVVQDFSIIFINGFKPNVLGFLEF